MNESFSDLSVLGQIQTNQEVLSYYNSLEENVIKGYAKSSVYGGYTANSEFEFLTGATKAFLPGSPYLQYIDDYLPNLITTIKQQQGYETAIAVHPYYPSGYNRNRVYPLLGFDEFLSLDAFSKQNPVRSYVGDSENYQKIIELYEQKEEGSSLCLFNVTMQNHNPYTDSEYIFEDPVYVTNFSAQSSVNQYFSLMKMSDDALQELISYFEKVDEPVLILLFGDHQPHLPDSFYRDVMGTDPDQFTQEQVMQKHTVPFMIWANYDIEEQTIENTSLNYLPTLLLQTAGLEQTDYDRFLADLQKTIPSISANGYYDNEGTLHSFSEEDPEREELIREYKIVQYNYLFGGEERLDRHFELSG
ncbi:MAG: LTA synthase family protein [Clostridiaceae bacterium]|nr:LTA synthase family protein [Clostridiaceae bacterium]